MTKFIKAFLKALIRVKQFNLQMRVIKLIMPKRKLYKVKINYSQMRMLYVLSVHGIDNTRQLRRALKPSVLIDWGEAEYMERENEQS